VRVGQQRRCLGDERHRRGRRRGARIVGGRRRVGLQFLDVVKGINDDVAVVLERRFCRENRLPPIRGGIGSRTVVGAGSRRMCCPRIQRAVVSVGTERRFSESVMRHVIDPLVMRGLIFSGSTGRSFCSIRAALFGRSWRSCRRRRRHNGQLLRRHLEHGQVCKMKG
jgi:hypothetical protein